MALPCIPNIALGRVIDLAILARDKPTGYTTCSLNWLLLKAANLESDALLRDYATIATLLGGASDECDFGAYARVAVTSAQITVTVDNVTNNDVDLNITANPSWNPTGAAQNVGAIVLFFRPDNASVDSANIPLFIDAAVGTTSAGAPFTYNCASTNGILTSIQG